MAFVHRKLYRQKPKQWGPRGAVQASIFKNAERFGIDPASIALAMPMWGPGDQLDYSRNGTTGVNTGATFQNNYLDFKSAETDSLITPQITGLPSQFAQNKGTLLINLQPVVYAVGSITTMMHLYNNYAGYPHFSPGMWQDYGKFVIGYRDVVGSGLDLTGKTSFAMSWGDGYLKGYEDGIRTINTANTRNYYTTFYGFSIACRAHAISATAYYGEYGVNLALAFSVILTASQIAYLSDNPYFLLQRVAPVYYSIPATGGGSLVPINPITRRSRFFRGAS